MRMLNRTHLQSTLPEKMDHARDLLSRYGSYLRSDTLLQALLEQYQDALQAGRKAMIETGMSGICHECDRLEGGSCCGSGIERKYDSTLLLLNLLLGGGIDPPHMDPRSCPFVGPEGCVLKARHVLCVNYLCSRISKGMDPIRLHGVQERWGRELDLQFQACERILSRIRSLEDHLFPRALSTVAEFFDGNKTGVYGNQGEFKSTDLAALGRCLSLLHRNGMLDACKTVFLDLGCGDGRVAAYMAYWVQNALGIEIDEDMIIRFQYRYQRVLELLDASDLPAPPGGIHVIQGDALSEQTYARLQEECGQGFQDVDVFYTHFTLHDLYADLIAKRAKPGAVYLVYGLNEILPEYPGLHRVFPGRAVHGILGVYQKALHGDGRPALEVSTPETS